MLNRTKFLLNNLKNVVDNNENNKKQNENENKNYVKQNHPLPINSANSTQHNQIQKKKTSIFDRPQLNIMVQTKEMLQDQREKEKQKQKELSASDFYSSKNKTTNSQNTFVNSSFARDLSNSSKNEHRISDRSAQSSPLRRPQNHETHYIPFQRNVIHNTPTTRPRMIPQPLKPSFDIDSSPDPPQGTRFIIEGMESTEDFLTLICVNDNGLYVVLNNKKKTIEWWPFYQLIEIGGPIEVDPIS